MLTPADFFELDNFEHRALFEGADRVWDVLPRIHGYLEAWFAALPPESPRIYGTILGSAYIVGDVFIGPGTVVEPHAMIKGPTWIGANVEVRQGAYIRGDAIIADYAVVGHTTEVKNAVLLEHAQAAHFAYVGDSVLGAHVVLGAGTKLANLKIVDSLVTVRAGEERYETGLRKFGAILGDRVETGCNSVTMPGTVLAPGCLVYPNTTARGYHPPRTVIRP
jgi:NDP-sugar pyrophosphorylase family protein